MINTKIFTELSLCLLLRYIIIRANICALYTFRDICCTQMLDNEFTVAHLSYAQLHHEIVHPFCQHFQLLQGIQKHALMLDNAKCSCTETCALHLHINRYAIGTAQHSEREREGTRERPNLPNRTNGARGAQKK